MQIQHETDIQTVHLIHVTPARHAPVFAYRWFQTSTRARRKNYVPNTCTITIIVYIIVVIIIIIIIIGVVVVICIVSVISFTVTESIIRRNRNHIIPFECARIRKHTKTIVVLLKRLTFCATKCD
jgi:uncharacterized metal-binding protein